MANSKFGPWNIEEKAGFGGQADVFRVTHDETGEIGALKRLKNPRRLNRFQIEIESVRALQHPNIIRLLDANISSEPYYAVFEFESGGALATMPRDELESTSMDVRLNWCLQISTALECAHGQGIVHRDIKPDNILLSQDRKSARLCDFGLVYIDDGERITATEEQVGSRYYIAPECEAGRVDKVGPATDLYSLGKVLYFVASGGKIYSRERQREDGFDLAKVFDDPFLEHISRVIDRVVNEESRLSDASTFTKLLSQASSKFCEKRPCPGHWATYRCIFCGHGTYTQSATSRSGHNEGYGQEGNIGSQFMVFLECNHCGNCQRFKVKTGGSHWFPDAFNEYQNRR